jgi:hypothetical protein
MRYQQFIFSDYQFSKDNKTLTLQYGFDDKLTFEETFRFNFDFSESLDEAVLDRVCQLLFFMAGVTYYKRFLPPEIVIKKGQIDQQLADFLSRTYQKGLGELFYLNKLDPKTVITFPVNAEAPAALQHQGSGMLVGIGGGKDSLAAVEMLRQQDVPITTWSQDHQKQLELLIERIGYDHLWVERTWDRSSLELRNQGAYRGHIPISAIFACAGTVAAVLSGKQDVVVSVEQSANEDTLEYQGVAINHQYSKTQAFERDFQAILQDNFGGSVRYYSFLRPLSELHIAEIFAKTGFEKYKDVFSSCNRAYAHDSPGMFWCGVCPKCAFVFLALTPFVDRMELEKLWDGKNLLLDPALEPMYRKLLGIEGDKPLECVGEVKENRSAMLLAQAIYPELTDKYSFELPEDYDYKALSSHEMPKEIYSIFQNAMQQIQ